MGIPDGRSNALGTYRVPNDRPEGLTDYRVQIIETQIVPGTSYLYVDPFVAAAPGEPPTQHWNAWTLTE